MLPLIPPQRRLAPLGRSLRRRRTTRRIHCPTSPKPAPPHLTPRHTPPKPAQVIDEAKGPITKKDYELVAAPAGDSLLGRVSGGGRRRRRLGGGRRAAAGGWCWRWLAHLLRLQPQPGAGTARASPRTTPGWPCHRPP
jgi:hypothetical protein